MDMASFVEVNKCCYKVEVTLMVVNQQVSGEANFMLYIFKDDNLSDRIKISLVNVTNEEDSYTCLLNRCKFEAMKFTQDLVIEYGDLIAQLESLLEPPKKAYSLKLKISEDIKLIIYTTTQLKLLTLLEIPFLRTSTKEIANNFKKQISDLKKAINALEISVSEFQEENQQLQLEVADRNKMYELSEMYQDKLNTIVPRLRHLEKENQTMKHLLEVTTTEKRLALTELTASRALNATQASKIEVFKKDVAAMKDATSYYINKTEDLKQMVDELQDELKDTVVAYKYDDLLYRFSHMTADLISKNVLLDEMEILGRQQKENNTVLNDRLNLCMKTISSLRARNKSSGSENEDVDVVKIDDEDTFAPTPFVRDYIDLVDDEVMPMDGLHIVPVEEIANMIENLEADSSC